MTQLYGVCVSRSGYKRDGMDFPPYTIVPIDEKVSRLLKQPGKKGSIRNCYVLTMQEKVKEEVKEPEVVKVTEPVKLEKKEDKKPKGKVLKAIFG